MGQKGDGSPTHPVMGLPSSRRKDFNGGTQDPRPPKAQSSEAPGTHTPKPLAVALLYSPLYLLA